MSSPPPASDVGRLKGCTSVNWWGRRLEGIPRRKRDESGRRSLGICGGGMTLSAFTWVTESPPVLFVGLLQRSQRGAGREGHHEPPRGLQPGSSGQGTRPRRLESSPPSPLRRNPFAPRASFPVLMRSPATTAGVVLPITLHRADKCPRRPKADAAVLEDQPGAPLDDGDQFASAVGDHSGARLISKLPVVSTPRRSMPGCRTRGGLAQSGTSPREEEARSGP